MVRAQKQCWEIPSQEMRTFAEGMLKWQEKMSGKKRPGIHLLYLLAKAGFLGSNSLARCLCTLSGFHEQTALFPRHPSSILSRNWVCEHWREQKVNSKCLESQKERAQSPGHYKGKRQGVRSVGDRATVSLRGVLKPPQRLRRINFQILVCFHQLLIFFN